MGWVLVGPNTSSSRADDDERENGFHDLFEDEFEAMLAEVSDLAGSFRSRSERCDSTAALSSASVIRSKSALLLSASTAKQ